MDARAVFEFYVHADVTEDYCTYSHHGGLGAPCGVVAVSRGVTHDFLLFIAVTYDTIVRRFFF